jgi:hypothetical protein
MEGYQISYLPYLDETKWIFVEPKKVGKRVLILYAVAHAAYNEEDKERIINWLKKEELWSDVAQSEIIFLQAKNSAEEACAEFTWRVESAYILAWALNLIHEKPSPEEESDTDKLEQVLPILGEPVDGFLENLQLRSQ